jgi:L-ascorbate metabolism protein UlaG (beta-lactamase superfamily)
MGAYVAALAGQRFFKLRAAIPCHYGSFPIIDKTADAFVAAMDGKGTQVVVPHKTVGVTI